jgi:hypothetical protein
LEVMG